jgi:RNA polymerase sigma-70 factor (ECF subfamily)
MSHPTVDELFTAGRLRWPEIALDLVTFSRFAGPRSQGVGSIDFAGDLYLACACAQGDARAIARFMEEFLGDVGRLLGRVRVAPGALDELRQELTCLLFVPAPGRPAKIETYQGRSSLRAWVRTVAIRTALRGRPGPTPPGDDALEDTPITGATPDLRMLKARYQAEFKEVFTAALRELSVRERNLLRQHFLHGLTFPEVARLYRVDRATAVRWVGGARKKLALSTRSKLMKRLDLAESDLGSVMRLVLSGLDLSLSDALR